MANARNKFVRTSDTLSSHFADFFFEYFIMRGIFFQNREKKKNWRGEWGRISAPEKAEKKTLEVDIRIYLPEKVIIHGGR